MNLLEIQTRDGGQHRIFLDSIDIAFLSGFVEEHKTNSNSLQFKLNTRSPIQIKYLEQYLSLKEEENIILADTNRLLLIFDFHYTKIGNIIISRFFHQIDLKTGIFSVVSSVGEEGKEDFVSNNPEIFFPCVEPEMVLFAPEAILNAEYLTSLRKYENRGLVYFIESRKIIQPSPDLIFKNPYWDFISKDFINTCINRGREKQNRMALTFEYYPLLEDEKKLKELINSSKRVPANFTEMHKSIRTMIKKKSMSLHSIKKEEKIKIVEQKMEIVEEKVEIVDQKIEIVSSVTSSNENVIFSLPNLSIIPYKPNLFLVNYKIILDQNISVNNYSEKPSVSISESVSSNIIFSDNDIMTEQPPVGISHSVGNNSFFSSFFSNFSFFSPSNISTSSTSWFTTFSPFFRTLAYNDVFCEVLRFFAAPGFPF
jgi:hypothetical protein